MDSSRQEALNFFRVAVGINWVITVLIAWIEAVGGWEAEMGALLFGGFAIVSSVGLYVESRYHPQSRGMSLLAVLCLALPLGSLLLIVLAGP